MTDTAIVGGDTRRLDSVGTRIGWWRSFRAMLRWQFTDLRLILPVIVAVQLLAGVGFVIGFGLFFQTLPPRAALFLTTGVPVIDVVTVAIVMYPQFVSNQKLNQTYDYLAALPVRRSVHAAASYVVVLVVGLPAVAATLAVAVARYHLHLDVHPALVPWLLLVALSATLIGLALGHAIEEPNLTQTITSVVIFAIFGYCPIMFPVDHLPRWLADVNAVLPFEYMATLTRAGLSTGLAQHVTRAAVVVSLYAGVSGGLAAWAMGRRR